MERISQAPHNDIGRHEDAIYTSTDIPPGLFVSQPLSLSTRATRLLYTLKKRIILYFFFRLFFLHSCSLSVSLAPLRGTDAGNITSSGPFYGYCHAWLLHEYSVLYNTSNILIRIACHTRALVYTLLPLG